MEADWENFMTKVNQVESIVKNLVSKNEKENEKATMQADLLLGNQNEIVIDETRIKEKHDRTLINQAAFDKEENPSTMSQEAFMKSVEVDVKQRSEDRRMRKETSDRLKNEGNKAFRKGDYEKALDLYNKAIEMITDSCLLYTNRALTCFKLGLNQRILEDTRKALFLNPKSLKAFLYRAQAQFRLGQYDDSQRTICEACETLPEKVNFILEHQRKWVA